MQVDFIRLIAPLLGIGFLADIANGLYFHIGETERKCFIEEIPEDTMVTADSCLLVLELACLWT